MPLEKEVKLNNYVKKTKGWNGADIEAVCRNAGMNAIKRIYSLKKKQNLTIKKQDFDKAIKEVSESIGKEIIGESAKLKKENKKLSKRISKIKSKTL